MESKYKELLMKNNMEVKKVENNTDNRNNMPNLDAIKHYNHLVRRASRWYIFIGGICFLNMLIFFVSRSMGNNVILQYGLISSKLLTYQMYINVENTHLYMYGIINVLIICIFTLIGYMSYKRVKLFYLIGIILLLIDYGIGLIFKDLYTIIPNIFPIIITIGGYRYLNKVNIIDYKKEYMNL